MYYQVFLERKFVFKLRDVYIIKCSSQGNFFKFAECMSHQLSVQRKENCVKVVKCIVTSSSVLRKGSCFRVAQCINHHVFIARKVVKSCAMRCSLQGKLF